MESDEVAYIRELLSATGWVERTREFARRMRRSTRAPGGLLLVGTPSDEPWHLAAHLSDESRLAGIPELSPTLIRWAPPLDAPPHLRVTLERLEQARRGETVCVVASEAAPVPLLERVSDARRVGATILALDEDDPELSSIAHDAISLAAEPAVPLLSFDAVQHLVSTAAGEPETGRRLGFRDRLARFIDIVSGPPPQR